MPVVNITHSGHLPVEFCNVLGQALVSAVAEELHTSGDRRGYLTPEDVLVHWQQYGQFDLHAPLISIEVVANDYPERRGNLDERTRRIAEALRKLPNMPPWFSGQKRVSLWVRLSPGAYETL